VTVDLVCHGVPAQRSLKEHINHIVKEKKIDGKYTIFFRNNDKFGLTLTGSDGNILYTGDCTEDLYMRTFMATETFRPSCYECKFAQPNRISDITICDFWGIKATLDIENEKGKGISCILVNTEKGRRLIDSIKDQLVMLERPLEEAVTGNTQLRHPSTFSKKAQLIRKEILAGKSFDEAAYDAHKSEIRNETIKKAVKAFDGKLPVPVIVPLVRFLKGKK
jgi:coenzyme F420-reducing hydrogenase beta subunit